MRIKGTVVRGRVTVLLHMTNADGYRDLWDAWGVWVHLTNIWARSRHLLSWVLSKAGHTALKIAVWDWRAANVKIHEAQVVASRVRVTINRGFLRRGMGTLSTISTLWLGSPKPAAMRDLHPYL